MSRRIVSYSFFRSPTSIYESTSWNAKKVGRQFEQFLPLLVRAHHAVWPDWTMRLHHDDRVMALPYFPALKAFHAAGLIQLDYVGTCDSLCGANGMLARLRPAFEAGVEYVACRDIDSIPLPRDRRCVEEFIESGRAVHTIHDHSAHSGWMGGTTTVRLPRFRDLVGCMNVEELIAKHGHGFDFTKQGADQHLLNRIAVTTIHGPDVMIHELHHDVGDMPGEIRRTSTIPMPKDIHPQAAHHGDAFSNVIGGCGEPLPAFDFYDDLNMGWISTQIKACEASVGIDARKLMEEIAAL